MPNHTLVNGSIGVVIGFDSMGHRYSVITGDERPEAYVHNIMDRPDAQDKFVITQTQELNSKDPDDEGNQCPISTPRWPIVRFTNGQVMQCIPASFEVVNIFGKMEATRHQVRCITTVKAIVFVLMLK
jgi:hypothetical protein